MSEWSRVKWTEAGQVAEMADIALSADAAALSPRLCFERMVERDSLDDASLFLAVALPRFESVAWAVETLRDCEADNANNAPTLAACEAWVAEPTEARRREAGRAAENADNDAPGRLAALATFLSGGSIAPEDLTPVQPRPDLCGRLAAATILTLAYRTAEPDATLRTALARGTRFATGDDGSRP